MRLLVTIGFSICLLSAITPRAIAQYQNPEWLEVSPVGESFHVSMPNQPRVEQESVGAVSGNRYVALTGVATYTIWSIKNANYRSGEDTDAYLDATAELLWDGLLKSAREQLDDKAQRLARMGYVKELQASTRGLLPAADPGPPGLSGREYTLTVGDVTGTAEFFVAQERIYVMLAMGKAGEDWSRDRFFSSFRVPPLAPSTTPTKPLVYGGANSAGASDADPNRIFSGREVTAKARVLEKAEPTYTESARKFGVTGRVVLRGVFSKNGEVTNLLVISKLPHGLTQQAISAARAIRFTPAMKDGQPVSMWMELQYNFNLY